MGYNIEIDRIKNKINNMEKKLQTIAKWMESDLSERPIIKLVKALLEEGTFPSKRSWMQRARVSADTFYKIENEVMKQLDKLGYTIVYNPSETSKRIGVELKEKIE